MKLTKFKVGDIVLSYYKGLWRILSIEKRKDYNPLMTIVKIATHRMLPCKPIIRTCDGLWLKYPLPSTIEYATSKVLGHLNPYYPPPLP